VSHLEDLLCEYYEWQGYLVRRNVRVGALRHGGHTGELDIVAYHPATKHLIHLEPSLDADAWTTREKRFVKKFKAGRDYVLKEVLPWLKDEVLLEQVAVLVSRGNGRRLLAGAAVRTIDEVVADIRRAVKQRGKMAQGAIPEQFGLLRTVQLVESGYYRRLDQ
jgi:hypothetical protein